MAKGRTNRWSTDQEDRLRALVLDGLTATRIGAKIGVTRNAVIGKIDRLGLRLLGGLGRQPGPQKPRKSRARKPKVTGVDILALDAGVCRWPQDTIEGVRYCGGETYPRHVYCPAHHRLAFGAG